jgi:Family of unknown function (DUF6206)
VNGVAGMDLALDLDRVDAAVQAAIDAGEPGELRVLGYGEITLVLGWPTEHPHLAVKRLPGFRHRPQLDRYTALVERYLAELDRRGVRTVPTAVRAVSGPDGELHAYLVQPLVRRDRMLNHVLRSARSSWGAELLERLAERVAGAVDARVGLDAQAANWAIEGDRMSLVDVSTPMLRDHRGREELELGPFVSIYPWALRAVLRPVARSIMANYHDPRAVLLDVASNLHKEELDRWVPALLSAANQRVSPGITAAEVRDYFARDKRVWLLLQHLRRADRAWQRRVRHRPYPFLLAPPYRYGPHPLPERKAA